MSDPTQYKNRALREAKPEDIVTVTNTWDVTDEVLNIAETIESEWFADEARIDWETFLDRMDGSTLPNGKLIYMGDSEDSAAIRKVKRHIREWRAAQ